MIALCQICKPLTDENILLLHSITRYSTTVFHIHTHNNTQFSPLFLSPRSSRQSALLDVQIVQTEGVGRLFAGAGTAVIGTAVSQSVYFYFYSLLREAAVARKHAVAGSTPLHGVSARSDPLSVGYSLAVASLAGAANVLLTNPIW